MINLKGELFFFTAVTTILLFGAYMPSIFLNTPIWPIHPFPFIKTDYNHKATLEQVGIAAASTYTKKKHMIRGTI